MVMVLCEVSDLAALWAANRLRARDVPVEIITAPVLGSALRWEHRVSADGEASVTIELGDGRTVSNASPGGVLNRLSFVPTERLDRVGGADRDYAVQEMNALFLSWLNAMPGPVVNRASPQGLGGAWRHRSGWIAMAGAAGLPTAPYRQSSADDPAAHWTPLTAAPVTVFAVGESAVAPPGTPQELQDGCLRLAKAAGEVLLGVDFAPGADGQLAVVDASAVPDLTRGGEPLIDALKEVLVP